MTALTGTSDRDMATLKVARLSEPDEFGQSEATCREVSSIDAHDSILSPRLLLAIAHNRHRGGRLGAGQIRRLRVPLTRLRPVPLTRMRPRTGKALPVLADSRRPTLMAWPRGGSRAKVAPGEAALADGIHLLRWLFDPLLAVSWASHRRYQRFPAQRLGLARKVHDTCYERNVPVWCSCMHEFDVGRAANVTAASLPGFTFTSDVSGSDKYVATDLVTLQVLAEDGQAPVRGGTSGLGQDVVLAHLEENLLRAQTIRPDTGAAA